MTVNEAQKLSKESRAALRSALKEQLGAVRKKVRHLRAKNLMGLKEPAADGEGVRQDVDSKLADGKADRSPDSDRGKDDRLGDAPKERAVSGDGEGPTPELKAEAENFFSKGNKPKPGKTKSFFGTMLINEQKSFQAEMKTKPKGGRKK